MKMSNEVWEDEQEFQEDYFDTVGFGPRLVAHIIDRCVLLLFYVIISNPIFLSLNSIFKSGENESAIEVLLMFPLLIIGILLTYLLYYAFFESSMRQATPGKMVMKIKVIDYDGERLSFGQAFGRSASRIITNMTFYIGYLMITWTKDEQALHDIIAKTLVVRED